MKESRKNNVIEQNNVQICSILNRCIVKRKLLKKGCVVTIHFVYFSISYMDSLTCPYMIQAF